MMDRETGKALFSSRQVLAVIVANMIGTGVFTSLGFQLVDIRSGFAILVLWGLGGLAALCGALSYAELGGAFVRSGGEYNFLGRIYHPAIGFMAGFVSATVGFAAPIALAAMAFASYLSATAGLSGEAWLERGMAGLLIILLALIHARSRQISGGFQTLFTGLKLLVIFLFCLAVLVFLNDRQAVSFWPQPDDLDTFMSAPFAISLIYVGYAYTGWNAATYIIGEMASPQRNLPRILLSGTACVMLLYLALNASFLIAAPMSVLAGQEEVGFIAAQYAFGDLAGLLAGLILAALLISTISAMTLTGPRVLHVIGQDLSVFGRLAVTNKQGVPHRAIWFQTVLALIFVMLSSFEPLLVFSGLLLSLMSFLAVLGLIILRIRQPDLPRAFRVPLFPLVPIVYLLVTGWALYFIMTTRPVELIYSVGLLGTALIVYAMARWRSAKPQREAE